MKVDCGDNTTIETIKEAKAISSKFKCTASSDDYLLENSKDNYRTKYFKTAVEALKLDANPNTGAIEDIKIFMYTGISAIILMMASMMGYVIMIRKKYVENKKSCFKYFNTKNIENETIKNTDKCEEISKAK